MRLVDIVRSMAPFISLVAIVLLATRRRLVRRLQAAGAYDAATAQPVADNRLTRFWERRLLGAGVLHAASGDRVWLDHDAWTRYQGVRKRRALTIAVTLAATLLAVAAYIKLR